MEIWNRYFIWKRFSADARVPDRIRFWGDQLYILLYDLGLAVARPDRSRHWKHALGLASGGIRCLISPPRHDEPAARREYDVSLVDLPRAGERADGEAKTSTARRQGGATERAI
jgi:hypothetical protein